MKILFIDIETTGLNHEVDSIRELSAIIRVDGRIKARYNKKNISQREYYKTFVEFLDKYVDKFDKNDKFLFAGYNGGFDMDFIRTLFKRNNNDFYGSYFWNPYYDIMQIALHKLRNRRHLLENFKLGTVARFLRIPVRETSLHNAEYDCNLAKEIYNKCV